MKRQSVAEKNQKTAQPRPPQQTTPPGNLAVKDGGNKVHAEHRADTGKGKHKVTKNGGPKESRANQLMAFFTGLLVLITCIYTYFSSKQWEVTQLSLQEAKLTREIENRAYVNIKSGSLVTALKAGEYPSVSLVVENGGHTPARRTAMRVFVESRDASAPEPDPLPGVRFDQLDPGRPYSITIVPPNITLNTTVVGTTAMTEELINAINQRKIRLYVWGVMEYDDVFGRHHKSQFCGAVHPGTVAFDNCAQGNDVD